jgi:hypothetical protein
VDSNSTHISDFSRIATLSEKLVSSWEQLYSKYAPLVYGVIYHITGEEKIAQDILEEVFCDIKKKGILLEETPPLCTCLLRHTFSVTLHHLNSLGIAPPPINPTVAGDFALYHILNAAEAEVKLQAYEGEVRNEIHDNGNIVNK